MLCQLISIGWCFPSKHFWLFIFTNTTSIKYYVNPLIYIKELCFHILECTLLNVRIFYYFRYYGRFSLRPETSSSFYRYLLSLLLRDILRLHAHAGLEAAGQARGPTHCPGEEPGVVLGFKSIVENVWCFSEDPSQ